jgi:hypothetical protein
MGGGGGGSGFASGSVSSQVLTQANRHNVANTASSIYTAAGGSKGGVNNTGRGAEGNDGLVVIRYLV